MVDPLESRRRPREDTEEDRVLLHFLFRLEIFLLFVDVGFLVVVDLCGLILNGVAFLRVIGNISKKQVLVRGEIPPEIPLLYGIRRLHNVLRICML